MTRDPCIIVLNHATENTGAHTSNATYARCMMGKSDVIPWNVQPRLIYSDWLYFQWHGIK